VIAAFVFVSGIFVFVSDSGKTCGNENDEAFFRLFLFSALTDGLYLDVGRFPTPTVYLDDGN
jgi:hypothetical protein